MIKRWSREIEKGLILLLLAINGYAADSKTVIKLGTLAPKNSPFYDIIDKVDKAWEIESGGKIEFKVYPGGIAGAEPDMIRKMKIGQLDAASVTAMGAFLIDPAILILQLPGMAETYNELDYLREKLTILLDGRMLEKGFIVLNHWDLGGLYFFTTKKATSVAELKRMKICTFATDRHTKGLWSKAGFTVVDLNSTDVLAALQTGLIDGIINFPVYAYSMQWFGIAKYMVNVKYGYAIGLTIMRKGKWQEIDENLQRKLMKTTAYITDEELPKMRDVDRKVIDQMRKHGLQIFQPDSGNMNDWMKSVLDVYPQVRDGLIPSYIFDRALKARDEMRKKGIK